MPTVHFTYARNSKQPDLYIETGANQISWQYNLNTQTYPTYGGEVVQILSVSMGNMTIVGDVPSYRKMEEIYKWFVYYLQDATQGNASSSGYSEARVTMRYPERGWSFQIQPMSLPGMRYGREVVVPSWQMKAHVIDSDKALEELAISDNLAELDFFKTSVTAGIQFRQANPFSDPIGILAKDDPSYPLWQDYAKIQGAVDTQAELDDLASRLNNVINSYLDGSYTDIIENLTIEDVSKPATVSKSDEQAQAAADHRKPGIIGKNLLPSTINPKVLGG